MHAVVLLKHMLDPELPPSRFAIGEDGRAPAEGIGPDVLGPYEQNALEVALQLKDAGGAERVTALAAGGAGAVESLRKALAVRSDEAARIDVEGLDPLDPAQTAELLTRAVQKLGDVDVIFAGRQAGDWDHGQVGYLVAERLGWPCVAFVRRAAVEDGRLRLFRQYAGGEEVLEAEPPAVVTVTNDDANVLRMPRVQDLMKARRKQISEWSPADLGLEPPQLAEVGGSEVLRLRMPEREQECEFVEGEEPEEVAAALVRRLRELKLL